MARPKRKVVVPTINDEPNPDDYVDGVKIIKLDYMGPDADTDKDYIRRLTSASNFDRLSIKMDEL